ncbi:MAG: PQQ-binding-like beta-propeller repeat protein, partial [Streptosporangiaceae bacterium]
MNGRLRMACLAATVITGLAPLAASSATASAAPAPTASTTVNWPGFHDNAADTGYNAKETTLGAGNVAGLSQQWLVSTRYPAGGADPTIGGGRLYTTAGPLKAWNALTGAHEWTANTQVTLYNVTFGGGRLFAEGANGLVDAFSAVTGKLEWSFTQPHDGSGSEPVYANGLVYLAGYFSMSAYNPATGAQVWSTTLSGLVRSFQAVSDGRLYLNTEGDPTSKPKVNFLALNASTGAVLWSREVGSLSDIETASPVASNDTVYQCSGSTLYALWAKTGDIRWTESDGCDIDSTPALANGVLYAAEYQSGQIYAINASTGAVEWSAPGTGGDCAAPAVANGVLYVPMEAQTVAAYDASTGALLCT